MRREVYWVILIIVTALVETRLLIYVRVQDVQPDLMLLLVAYFAVAEGEERAMFTGFLGGVFQDVAGPTGLGHHVLSLVLVGYVIGRVSKRLVTEHPAVRVGLVFCACLLHGLIYALVDYVQNPGQNALYEIGVSVIPGAFYTCLAMPLVFIALDQVRARWLYVQNGAS